MRMRLLTYLILLSFLVQGCTHQSTAPGTPLPPTQVQVATGTIPPTSTPLPTATPVPVGAGICSPLDGITLEELPGIISNPFDRPLPGRDDGHHGVDFAFWSYKHWSGMAGLQILSVLPGTVAATIQNRKPYGNAIMIETKLENLPKDWQPPLPLLTPQPTVQPHPALTCPTVTFNPALGVPERSLYLLYAHMQEPAQFDIGQNIACGQVIGKVGTTGSSVNDHLHLETRMGPSNIQFGNMLFYDTGGTPEDYHDYCTWRVSGLFQMFDPMLLLFPPEEDPRNGG